MKYAAIFFLLPTTALAGGYAEPIYPPELIRPEPRPTTLECNYFLWWTICETGNPSPGREREDPERPVSAPEKPAKPEPKPEPPAVSEPPQQPPEPPVDEPPKVEPPKDKPPVSEPPRKPEKPKKDRPHKQKEKHHDRRD